MDTWLWKISMLTKTAKSEWWQSLQSGSSSCRVVTIKSKVIQILRQKSCSNLTARVATKWHTLQIFGLLAAFFLLCLLTTILSKNKVRLQLCFGFSKHLASLTSPKRRVYLIYAPNCYKRQVCFPSGRRSNWEHWCRTKSAFKQWTCWKWCLNLTQPKE